MPTTRATAHPAGVNFPIVRAILAGAACLLIACPPCLAGKFNRVLSIGDPAPVWSRLPGVDGKPHSLADYREAQVVVIAFTCNHCPVAQAYEARFRKFVNDYQQKKVAFLAISCSLIDTDNLAHMKERAQQEDFNYDYLHDAQQDSGRQYGATVTPHLFVLDQQRKIAYMGAFDDNFVVDRVEEHYVRDAVDAVLNGREPEVTESRQSGCAIQYEARTEPTSPKTPSKNSPAPQTPAPTGKPPVSNASDQTPIQLVRFDPTRLDQELKAYRGQVVLIDFWATWCIPCRKQFPHTVDLHRRYARNGLAVMSVCLDEADAQQHAKSLKFLRQQKAAFRNLLSNQGSSDEALEALDIDGGALPHYKLYDRQGKLIRKFGFDFENPIKPEQITAAVRQALDQK